MQFFLSANVNYFMFFDKKRILTIGVALLAINAITGCRSVDSAFNWKMRTAQKIANKTDADTVYVLLADAFVHDDVELPFFLWYHDGDDLVAYRMQNFRKKKYVVADTVHFPVDDTIQNYSWGGRNSQSTKGEDDCLGSQRGWDLLDIYIDGEFVTTIRIDQRCLLTTTQRNNSLGHRLKHDIALLRKYIPKWMTINVASDKQH